MCAGRVVNDGSIDLASAFEASLQRRSVGSYGVEPHARKPNSMVGGDRGEALRQRGIDGFRTARIVQDDEMAVHAVVPSEDRLLTAFTCLPRSHVCDEQGVPIVWPWESEDGVRTTQQVLRRTALPIDDKVHAALNRATSSGDGGESSTGVRAWRGFCKSLGISPHRPLDPNEPLWVKLEEEWLAMRFVCDLVERRGIKPKTASAYFGAAQAWHLRRNGIRLAAGIKLERLTQMLKGLTRIHGDGARRVRRGLRARDLRVAMDLLLDPRVPEHANMRAALATAWQGLLRGAEFTTDKQWDSELDLARGDVAALSALRFVLMMRPSKNMNHLKGKTVPLVIGAGGQFIDAVAEMQNMLEVDPSMAGKEASTPLFRDRWGKALTGTHMRNWIKAAMNTIGLNPDQFGLHSLRIGGATALFAAGADPLVIRTMGRWSSDCYRLYVRACFSQTQGWTRIAGSTQADDIAGEFEEVDSY